MEKYDDQTMPAYSAGGGATEVAEAGFVLLFADEYRDLASVYPFERDVILVGRDVEEGNIKIPQVAVSRVHARISRVAEGFSIRDLDSRNGVLVGGRPVDETLLRPNDEVRIGDAIFKFVPRDARAYAPYRIDGVVEADARRVTISGAVGGLRMARVSAEIVTAAASTLPVLIFGETGTGKELAARAVHEASGRGGPFRALNCAAIPPNLVESELFGFKRGAFSGATRDHPGLVRAANGGTLLLDEIGDMPLEAQAKLLRTLETGEILPVGAVVGEKVDVRIVGATHRDLRALVEGGTFRGDLFARLNGYSFQLPPLRERKEDVYMLVRHFLAMAGEPDRGVTFPFMLSACSYPWPYNVRELASAVKRAVTLAEGRALDAGDLPEVVTEFMAGYGGPLRVARTSLAPASMRPSAEELADLLRQHGGNIAAVARVLGKDRAQVHRWMRRFGLEPKAFRP